MYPNTSTVAARRPGEVLQVVIEHTAEGLKVDHGSEIGEMGRGIVMEHTGMYWRPDDSEEAGFYVI